MDCINHGNKLQRHLRNFAILDFMIWQQAMMKVNRSYWFKLVTCDLEHPIKGSALFQHRIFAFVCWVKLDFLSQVRAKGHSIGPNITELRKKNCYTKLEFVYDIESGALFQHLSFVCFCCFLFQTLFPGGLRGRRVSAIHSVRSDRHEAIFLLSQHATSVDVVDGLQLPKPHLEQVFKKFFSMAHSHVVCFVLLNQF